MKTLAFNKQNLVESKSQVVINTVKMSIMKKVTTLIVLAFIGLFTFAQDENQEINIKKNTLGIEVTKLLSSTISVEYERLFSNNTALHVSGGLTLKLDDFEEAVGGLGEIQYRFYSFKSFDYYDLGFYMAPFAKYQYLDYGWDSNWDNPDAAIELTNYQSVSGGVLVGFKSYFLKRMYADINAGGGLEYCFDAGEVEQDWIGIRKIGYTGVFPQMNITMGIMF